MAGTGAALPPTIKTIAVPALINKTSRYRVEQRLTEALSEDGKALKNAKILVLGLAYKKDVDDVRELYRFERRPLYVQVNLAGGKHFRVLGLHLKSKAIFDAAAKT